MDIFLISGQELEISTWADLSWGFPNVVGWNRPGWLDIIGLLVQMQIN
jgi:hypothetical protein